MINYLENIAVTNVKTTAPKLTKPDAEKLGKVIGELKKLDEKFAEIDSIRDAIRESAIAYGRGDIPLDSAIAMAGIPPENIAAVRGAMRQGVKIVMKEAVQAVAHLVQQHRDHSVVDLLARCQKLEAAERSAAADAGIHADEYQPSGLLLGLREQHSRAVRDASGVITRSDVNKLAATLGMPTEPEPELKPLAEAGE